MLIKMAKFLKKNFAIFLPISLLGIAVGIGLYNRVNVEHLTGQRQGNLAVKGDAQMVANRKLGAALDVGVDNDFFANVKIAVARVGHFHKAPALFHFEHLAGKIRVFGIQFVGGLLARTNGK